MSGAVIEVPRVEVAAEVFDAMEATANQFGGVGGFVSFYDPTGAYELRGALEPIPGEPFCAMGLARWADNVEAGREGGDAGPEGPVRNAVGTFWGVVANDDLFREWLDEQDIGCGEAQEKGLRMPWPEYVKRAGWVRVELPPCAHCGGVTARERRFGDLVCVNPNCFACRS